MEVKNKIGIVTDRDFATKNFPPYPRPFFLSYENPRRIEAILDYLEKEGIFKKESIVKYSPKAVDDSIIELAHTKYYIDTVKRMSSYGSGALDSELFITNDTFDLAKKAVGGCITAIEKVIEGEVNQSFALIRPPGHHALREKGSGLCIFNNIANSILYLRKVLNYNKKIAIVDIDNHFGDGISQFFYEDASVLYCSIHEFDYLEGDIGFITDLGKGEGEGKKINFPVPDDITDADFVEFIDLIEPILKQFLPDIIIVAAGFDMYFDDAIGNGCLTSVSYFNFAKDILRIAENVCKGKLAFVLEGGYSLIGLPICVFSTIKALLKEDYEPPFFEKFKFLRKSKNPEITKIKSKIKEILKKYWAF